MVMHVRGCRPAPPALIAWEGIMSKRPYSEQRDRSRTVEAKRATLERAAARASKRTAGGAR